MYLFTYLMGYRWEMTIEMWPAKHADITQLKAADIIINSLSYGPRGTISQR
jgi:hypothetical protein